MDDSRADEQPASEPAKPASATTAVAGRSRAGILRHYLSAIPDPSDDRRREDIVSLINPQLCLPLTVPDLPARPPATVNAPEASPGDSNVVAPVAAVTPMRRSRTTEASAQSVRAAPAGQLATIDLQARRAGRIDQLARDAAQLSLEDPWTVGAVGYISSGLLQCTLPHTCPDPSLQAWGRTANKRSLVIQQGYYMAQDPNTGHTTPRPIGYPYGSIPRFILAWVGREAVLKRTRVVTLGESLETFMRDLGMEHVNGGKRGSRTRVRDQIRRLFAARIALLDNVDPKDDVNWAMVSWQLADRMQLWSRQDANGNPDVNLGQIELSQQFYDELSEHPVPLDMRVLRTLARSTFALDLYSWLSYRASFTSRQTMIPWNVLQDQFGAECATPSKFRQLFRRALAMVHAVYPEANFNADSRRGFILMPSRPALPKKVHALGAVADATTPRVKSARKSA